MKNFRITKYNPDNRNTEGHYQLDEWTCPSEIGRKFNGLKFEETEYFEIESKYIDAAIKLVISNSLDRLRVVNLNTTYMRKLFSDQDYLWLLDSDFKDIKLFEDKALNITEIKSVIKMILRNFMGCSLEVDGKFRLHFGYDFYMYVSTTDVNLKTLDEIKNLGLFVEEINIGANTAYEFSIDIVDKGDEIVKDTVILENFTRNKIRNGLRLSVEHPCNHHFQITGENYSMFTDQTTFDFDINEYFLCCERYFS